MKKTLFIALLLFAMTFQLMAVDFPVIKGFRPESEPMQYHSENLYEYINGAADAYLAYGFRNLLTRDFSFGNLKFTVDIYDMGSRINAFGMYKTERPAEVKVLKIGIESVVSPPYQCLLLKGAYYVKINIFEGEFNRTNGKAVLTAVAEALSGSDELPEELHLLPEKNRIPDSEGYTREGFLGLDDLSRCVFATYKLDSATFRYFVMLPSTEESAKVFWKKLAAKWNSEEIEGMAVLYKKVPYKGFVGIVQSKGHLIGVTDCQDKAQMLHLLKNLF